MGSSDCGLGGGSSRDGRVPFDSLQSGSAFGANRDRLSSWKPVGISIGRLTGGSSLHRRGHQRGRREAKEPTDMTQSIKGRIGRTLAIVGLIAGAATLSTS